MTTPLRNTPPDEGESFEDYTKPIDLTKIPRPSDSMELPTLEEATAELKADGLDVDELVKEGLSVIEQAKKKEVKDCPEFPFFGATYPDATCIDGYLWDLDKCDSGGLYSTGDNPPCPFCNSDKHIEHHQHDDGFTIEVFNEWKQKIIERYGRK